MFWIQLQSQTLSQVSVKKAPFISEWSKPHHAHNVFLQFVNPSGCLRNATGVKHHPFSMLMKPDLATPSAQVFRSVSQNYKKKSQHKASEECSDTRTQIFPLFSGAEGSVSMVWTSVWGLKPFHSVSSTIVRSFSGISGKIVSTLKGSRRLELLQLKKQSLKAERCSIINRSSNGPE